MIRLFALAMALISLSMIQFAAAGNGCAYSDSPMSSSAGFGITSCKRYAPRYHMRDYLGEGARGFAGRASSDPMVWSDARWRSTLTDGYARTTGGRYDLRFRRMSVDERRIKRIEKVTIVSTTQADKDFRQVVKPRGPKIAYLRHNVDTQRMERGSTYVGNQCRGILVLTWKAGVARSRCIHDNARIRRAPG